MATAPTGIANLTFNSVIIALVTILLAIDVYIRVMTAIKTHREEMQRRNTPVDTLEEKVEKQEEKLDEHEDKLRKDYERLNELEDGTRIMMRAMMAMLSHEINGNSTDKLMGSLEEIQQFLINK